MVKGLETFRKAMAPYKEHFVIIGGTACDIRLTGTTMIPRATDDIDIIVVIDRLNETEDKLYEAFTPGKGG